MKMKILRIKIDQTWTFQGLFKMLAAENDKKQSGNF